MLSHCLTSSRSDNSCCCMLSSDTVAVGGVINHYYVCLFRQHCHLSFDFWQLKCLKATDEQQNRTWNRHIAPGAQYPVDQMY